MNDDLPFDWSQMPRILESRRQMAINAMISGTDFGKVMELRAQVLLLDELMRLPLTEKEEREFRNFHRREEDGNA